MTIIIVESHFYYFFSLVPIHSHSSGNSVQSSQISKFFNRPSSADSNHSNTGRAMQSTDDGKKSTFNDPSSSSNSKQSENDDDASTSSSDTNAKVPKTSEKRHEIERVKTKRLFDADNAIADSKNTIKNFFATEHNESLGEFEIPTKIARKSSKTATTKTRTTAKKAKTTKSRSKKQSDIRNILKKQNDGIDLNEDEELQLAMELSMAESTKRIDLVNFDEFEYKQKNGKQFQINLSYFEDVVI